MIWFEFFKSLVLSISKIAGKEPFWEKIRTLWDFFTLVQGGFYFEFYVSGWGEVRLSLSVPRAAKGLNPAQCKSRIRRGWRQGAGEEEGTCELSHKLYAQEGEAFWREGGTALLYS